MKLIKFLKSRTFLANVILVVVIGVLGYFAVNSFLSSITDHGDVVVVPDLKTYDISEVEEVLGALELTYEILDSAEFTKVVPPGAVLDQYPGSGMEVKRGRSIKLTVNRLKPRLIEVPSVVEKTLRRAIYDIESKGFVVGELKYIPDLGKDVIIALEYKGKPIDEGQRLPKGEKLDLIVGMGLSNELVSAPVLSSLNLADAESKLLANSLNLGVVFWDDDISDSTAAKVYKQNPNGNQGLNIRMGASVDVWMTNDYTKIAVDTLHNP